MRGRHNRARKAKIELMTNKVWGPVKREKTSFKSKSFPARKFVAKRLPAMVR
jgi:hypothetical protein